MQGEVATMTRRFINQLGDRETVKEVFLLGDKQLRQNRNGNLYLQMRLSDRTGSLTGMMWNASDEVARGIDNGDFVHVEGATQFYNGNLQIIVKCVEPAELGSIAEEDFIQVSQAEVERLTSQLVSMLRGLGSLPLRSLAECFLGDDEFMRKFRMAPAAVKNHHAFRSGLLAHVVTLMRVCRAVAEFYPRLDRELLVMGAFLHDVGKIDELDYDRDLAYTDEGQLVGHLVMGVSILDQKLAEVARLTGEPFPEQLALRLKHMIISHHGKLEFGSPKVPMTPEAVALHYLDDLDAKLHWYQQVIEEDVNTDSRWTPFQPNLGRKLFKGESSEAAR